MTPRERIRNIIEHRPADQIGVAFNPPHKTDLVGRCGCTLKRAPHILEKHDNWGKHPELLAKIPEFNGEVRMDLFGNIIGRLDSVTKGECVHGALNNWEDLDNYDLPEIEYSAYTAETALRNKTDDKYIIATAGWQVFSTIRDVRLMDNALMDLILEPENVSIFMDKVLQRNLEYIDVAHEQNADGYMFFDDWGTQDRTFISPSAFRKFFKPVYKKVAEKLHGYGMHLLVHSCGYNYAFMEDFIDAGVDVLQFDQLGAYGYERMADEFAGRVTFWSPLDIQMTLPTGDKALIESEALKMVQAFKGKGSLILKDYPSLEDIGVKDEWANWAREVFNANLAVKN